MKLLQSPLHCRVTPKVEVLQIFEKWHTAYHGCHTAAARRILDTGDLHVSGMTYLDFWIRILSHHLLLLSR